MLMLLTLLHSRAVGRQWVASAALLRRLLPTPRCWQQQGRRPHLQPASLMLRVAAPQVPLARRQS
jgi:hypothetical protein